MADSAALSLAIGLGVTNTFTVWTTLNPALPDVRDAATDDPSIRGQLRTGERDAALIALGIAIAASVIIRSPLPFFTSLALIGVLWYVYESARKVQT